MVESEIAERIAARRAELDELEEQLAKQLDEVRAERDELAIAERVWQQMAEQIAVKTAAAEPVTTQVRGPGGAAGPAPGPGVGENALPPEYQRILAIVRQAGAPVAAKQVGEVLEVAVRGKLEPLRGKLSKLADRGWLRKLPDGRFTARL
ncbi:hypothetical protein OG585_45920 [Streptomyces sp. NBC_01340]|uniref:hypothetical protein n=1 Tax=unclassified Streptomyces TaxID=2593676 RepID=UPI00225AA6D0|nr:MULTISPECIES: hypothetical protein [unclassified Streptomyces]MCX4460051.1 hypothetical protein [Streptomyces sp. NBC_01719]MCX4499410.1 hypothetical protein [Streptomyces sp. NBC_01728]MCX4594688.1 hypothetical protein [Streptomyces sp. NBC_01549]WSI36029.1 hypothetical protein OG585_01000 [Streptomyces sp. NBC_01340]WSI43784.1 hypothetical protein OG585_45920 [Streptomyces sp. NBC_01340]